MNVAGIDLSTRAVDIVKVPLEHDQPPTWHRFPLDGSDAFDRARAVRDAMPGRSSEFWDDVMAIGIEDPRGHGAGHIYRVQGAVLACLPPHLLVHPLIPSAWRKLVGLKGNAAKSEVQEWAPRLEHIVSRRMRIAEWPQDACDAYCIAHATRTLITSQKASA